MSLWSGQVTTTLQVGKNKRSFPMGRHIPVGHAAPVHLRCRVLSFTSFILLRQFSLYFLFPMCRIVSTLLISVGGTLSWARHSYCMYIRACLGDLTSWFRRCLDTLYSTDSSGNHFIPTMGSWRLGGWLSIYLPIW